MWIDKIQAKILFSIRKMRSEIHIEHITCLLLKGSVFVRLKSLCSIVRVSILIILCIAPFSADNTFSYDLRIERRKKEKKSYHII